MKNKIQHCCALMNDFLEDSGIAILYSPISHAYSLPWLQKGKIIATVTKSQIIDYCPWCGKKLSVLTPLQVYKTMICFLDNYYNKTLSDDLSSLLGDLQLCNSDSTSCDPAAWHDWMKALRNDQRVTIIDGFRAMTNFLDAYSQRTLSVDIKFLLNDIQQEESGEVPSAVWNSWIKCIDDVTKK